LVEHALRLARRLEGPPQIADVGAGSGAIAVALATHLPEATIYALDDSAGALAVTARNAHRHGVSNRVRPLQGDLLAPLPGAVDIITANLPYVTTGEWETLPPEIRLYEPRGALDGGPDGLGLIRRLLATAGRCLLPGGALLLEIGASQGEAVCTLARQSAPQSTIRLYQDYAGLDRLVVVQT
jgi:release factor glutamine methyltransferase